MYHLEAKCIQKDQPLESFIKVDGIKKNPKRRNTRIENPQQVETKGKGILRKGFNFSKFTTKNALEPPPKPKPSTKKNSCMKLIEKLKEIEKPQLKNAKEELEIASKQIEEINKLLSYKAMQRDMRLEEETLLKTKYQHLSRHRCSTNEINKKFQRMQQNYLKKPKIPYRSMKDIDLLMRSRYSANSILSTIKEEAIPEDFCREKEEPKVEVLYNVLNRFSDDSRGTFVKEFAPSSEELNVKKTEHQKRSLYELVFENTRLEESILKSDYLVKVFNTKKCEYEDEKGVKLFKNAVKEIKEQKSRESLTEANRRESKILSALNLALKNSFYTTASNENLKT